jgi:hypothetical protein
VGLAEQHGQVPPDFVNYIEQTNPENELPVLPIRPIYRPDSGQPSVATDSALGHGGRVAVESGYTNHGDNWRLEIRRFAGVVCNRTHG